MYCETGRTSDERQAGYKTPATRLPSSCGTTAGGLRVSACQPLWSQRTCTQSRAQSEADVPQLSAALQLPQQAVSVPAMPANKQVRLATFRSILSSSLIVQNVSTDQYQGSACAKRTGHQGYPLTFAQTTPTLGLSASARTQSSSMPSRCASGAACWSCAATEMTHGRSMHTTM